MIRRFALLFLILFCLAPLRLWAYASVTVPVDDPIYRHLDTLASFGLIKTMMRGQRPYVRAEIGRLIAEALENYPELEKKYREDNTLTLKQSEQWLSSKIRIDRLLEKLKDLYKEELIQRGVLPGKVPTFAGRPLEFLGVDYLYLSENPSTFPLSNGLEQVTAQFRPLVQDREGRHFQKGHTWSIESSHWGRLGKYVAMQFRHRSQLQIASGPLNNDNGFYVQRLNAHFTFNKLDLEVGRDSINWGVGARGGLGFTSNARPLDFIKLSSVSPFEYPFIFSKLGMNEMSLVIANLGPETFYKDSFLVAYKISNRRNEYFELGISQLMLIGGDGAPSGGFGQSVLDFFDVSENNNRVTRAYLLELDGHMPFFRGSELYLQLSFDDFTTDLGTMFLQDTSYLVGFYMPRLTFSGSMNFRAEYRHLGPRYSRSAIYPNGFSENGFLIGDPLGSDSQGVLAQLNWEFNARNLLSFELEYQHRNNNFYRMSGNDIQIVARGVDDDRMIYRGRWEHLFGKHFKAHLGLGLEQAFDQNYFANQNKLNWMAEVGFRFHLSGDSDI